MCVGVPFELVKVDGTNALGRSSEGLEPLDLSLIGTQPVGTWVLGFLGAAREILDRAQAEKIEKALGALRSLQAGGDIGDAFDDIINSEPQLPPHLEAARREGKREA